jgi:hypothetical protein
LLFPPFSGIVGRGDDRECGLMERCFVLMLTAGRSQASTSMSPVTLSGA